jgi:hypothetical protein
LLFLYLLKLRHVLVLQLPVLLCQPVKFGSATLYLPDQFLSHQADLTLVSVHHFLR